MSFHQFIPSEPPKRNHDSSGSGSASKRQRVYIPTRPSLIEACKNNDLQDVEYYLQHNADVNQVNHRGQTPLFIASLNNNIEIIRLLLSVENIDVNPVADLGFTPLSITRSVAIVHMLIEAGANINQRDHLGRTLLMNVSQRGRTEIVRILIEHGADISVSSGHKTATYMACEHGHAEIVRLLLAAGADINQTNFRGKTLLRKASQYGYIDVVRVLLEAGANPNQVVNGETPIYTATRYGRHNVVRMLLEAGVEINDMTAGANITDTTLLYIASKKGYDETVRVLLEFGADVNQMNNIFTCATPLFIACQEGHVETVRVLLEHGADINQRDVAGQTPLFAASHAGHTEVVRVLLIDKHILFGIKEESGYTALKIATLRNHVEIAQMIQTAIKKRKLLLARIAHKNTVNVLNPNKGKLILKLPTHVLKQISKYNVENKHKINF